MKRQRILGEAEGFADPKDVCEDPKEVGPGFVADPKDFCEDPKEVVPGFVEVEDPDQILEEEEVQSSDGEDDEIADSEELQSSSDEDDDDLFEKPSYVRGYFMRHEVKRSASVLKDYPEVVLLCREILKYFASKYDDDGDNVKDDSFLKMADQVLAHYVAFKNFLQKHCEHCEFNLYYYDVLQLGRENESKLKTANHLSLIKRG